MTDVNEPLWDVVEEHLEEAEFLWEQWEASLVAPNYVLREVEDGPEGRLLAHLDGLVVNGPLVAERLLLPTIADVDAEPTRVSAAALALLQTAGDAGFDAVFSELHGSPSQRPELVRALECCDLTARPSGPGLGPLYPRLGGLLAAEDADLRHAAARVLAYHGEALDEVVPGLLASERAVDRALGLRLVPSFAGGGRHRHAVLAALASEDPDLRDAALTSGALLDLPQAWGCARALVTATDPTAGPALLLLALRGDPADAAALAAAVGDEALRGSALWALGFLGTAAAVELALPWLEDGAHARLAGEAVAAITGLDLEDEGLTRVPEEDEALEHRPEDDLPLPNPMGVLVWWRRQRGDFAGDLRYLGGKPRDAAALRGALHEGPMRRRAAHLLALQLGAGPGRWPRLETTAPSRRQWRELAAL